MKGASTVAIPKLALLTDLLTMGLGRNLELKKVPSTEDNSLSLSGSHSLFPGVSQMEKNSSAVLYYDVLSFRLPYHLKHLSAGKFCYRNNT